MKKTLLFLLAFLPSAAFADTQAVGGQWRGLHNSDASILIDDNEAQSLSNVDITESGYAIRKRDGTVQFKTIGTSTWSVRGGYFFRDTSANENIIHANNRSVFKSVAGAAYTAFITTDTAGSYYDFTDSQGSLWRATNNNDEICKYDGTTLTYYPSSPKGTQVEFTPDRLVISGTTANPNRLNFSKVADPTTFTTGNLDTDPFTTDIGLPGQKIQAIKYALGRLLIWTKTSLSYWYGTNQYDQTVQDISTSVGTDQPYSIVSDLGVVYWQAQDKHFYAYDGNGITKISRKLDVSNFGGGSSPLTSWEMTTQSDFASGTTATGLSTSSSPGDVAFVAVIEQLSQTQRPQYDVRALAQSFNPTSSFILSYASVLIDHPTSGSSFISTWTIRSDSAGVPSSTILSTATVFINNDGTLNVTQSLAFSPAISLTAGTTYWLYLASAPVGGFSYKPTWNDSASNPYSGGNLWSSDSGVLSSLDACFALYNASATYVSPAQSMASASAFNTVTINNTLGGGAITYGIYRDTDTSIDVTNTATFTSSETITNGAIPSIGIGNYTFWSARFSRTASTATANLNDMTITWNTSNVVYSWGSVDKDHRIIWSVAEGTATTTSASYIYDPRFDTWLKYSVPFDAVARVGDSLYYGGASTGVVYGYPSGNTDNGSAITAFWKSKDFISGDLSLEKTFSKIGLVAKSQTGSSLSLEYFLNGSAASSKTYTVSLTESSGNPFIRFNENFPTGTFSSFINFKFGNTTGDSPFEVYTLKYDYTLKPWRVLP